MLLTSFKYRSQNWILDGLTFGESNLIVGKNSSGKSKALEALSSVISIISQRSQIDAQSNLETEISLMDSNDNQIIYSFGLCDKEVSSEKLLFNGRIIINRSDSEAVMDGERVYPPRDMLLIHVRRDLQKYPIIEELINWSEEAVIRSFIHNENPNHDELYEIIARFTPEMKNHLVKMANQVGFPISQIDTFDNLANRIVDITLPYTTELKLVLIREEGVESMLFLRDLSSGMYRTILLLILIEQLINLDHPALIAIDDLGEGLDYSRATQVGRLLFDICREKKIQIVATSNEEFMMNIVDISNWNILVRKGDHVKSITSNLCPEYFEEFKFSGLDNFDFFTSDFLSRISSNLLGNHE